MLKNTPSQLAFVLHHRVYRESSLLLELFTHEAGRVSVIARGAKRSKSPLRHICQLFQPIYVSWYGKHELMNLQQAEIAKPLPAIRAERLAWAFYLNELLYRLLPRHEALPNLFAAYGDLIEKLSHSEATEVDLRYFEKTILTELGYGLQLTHDNQHQQTVTPEHYYHFVLEQGPIRTELLHDQAHVYQGKDLLALADNHLHEESAQIAAKRLLRHTLAELLNHRPLKSREMLFS